MFICFKLLLRAYLTCPILLANVLAIGSNEDQTSDKRHIGFTLIETTRPSNDWSSQSTEKPLKAWFWYPTERQVTGNITYREYLNYLNPDKHPADQLATFQRIVNGFQEDSISIHALETYISGPAPVRILNGFPDQPYPLVVLSGAHPIYFVELAERLAQSGFGVLSLPRTGKKSGERLPYTVEGVQEYEADLQAVLERAQHLRYADMEKLAFVSWSFEGIATLQLAIRLQASCFMSLDAALGYDYGVPLVDESLFKEDMFFSIAHYTSSGLSHGKDLTLLQKQKNHVELITDYELSHGDFTSLGSLTAHRLIHGVTNPRYEALIDEVLNRLKMSLYP